MPLRTYRRDVALMGHPIKVAEKNRTAWLIAFRRAQPNRRCATCRRFAMSASVYCGRCHQAHRYLAQFPSFFPPGTGRLGVVEPAQHTEPRIIGRFTPGVEVHEGFTVPPGFAALGE